MFDKFMKKKRLDDYTSSLCWRKKFLVMRAGCFSSNLGKCARQTGFFGHQVGDAKWRVDEDQRSDRGKYPL